MTTNDATRAALVQELGGVMHSLTNDDEALIQLVYTPNDYAEKVLMPIIDRLLTTRPEPAADAVETRFPAPDFEWDVDSVIEAREEAGEPGDPDTAQRVVDIAHDVLLTFKYTLETYPFSNLNTVVWLVSEMVRIAEEKAAAVEPEPGLDELLDSVHPKAMISFVFQHDSEPWIAGVRWPYTDEIPIDSQTFASADGTGPTRMAAIADAVRQAKGTEGSE